MREESFGIVPLRKQDEQYLFLLIQHHAGHWGFPKGHAEPGESTLESACREFEEETGIREYQLLGQQTFQEHYKFIRQHQTIEKIVLYYLALVETSTVSCQAAEIRNYAWVSLEEAMKLMTFEAGRRVLVAVKQYLETALSA